MESRIESICEIPSTGRIIAYLSKTRCYLLVVCRKLKAVIQKIAVVNYKTYYSMQPIIGYHSLYFPYIISKDNEGVDLINTYTHES